MIHEIYFCRHADQHGGNDDQPPCDAIGVSEAEEKYCENGRESKATDQSAE